MTMIPPDTCAVCEKATLRLRFNGKTLFQDCRYCGTTQGNDEVLRVNATIQRLLNQIAALDGRGHREER